MQEHLTVKDIIIENFRNLTHETMFLLKALPQDKLGSSDKQMKKLNKLARHIAVIPFEATLNAEEYFCEHPTPVQLREVLEETFGDDLLNFNYPAVFEKACDYFLSFYNTKCDESLVNRSFINYQTKEATPYLKSFLKVQNHIAQHTGNLSVYIRDSIVPETMNKYIETTYYL